MESIRMDADLPIIMASLDLMGMDSTLAPNDSTANETRSDLLPSSSAEKRVLRKRKLLIDQTKPANRRVTMKPRKRVATDMSSPKEIEDLYLNKKIKSNSQTLETIYEEGNAENNEPVNLIGGRKMRRQLTFQLGSHYTKEKIKKRRAKIKKLLGSKTFLNRKRIPMAVFLKSFECFDKDQNVNNSKMLET